VSGTTTRASKSRRHPRVARSRSWSPVRRPAGLRVTSIIVRTRVEVGDEAYEARNGSFVFLPRDVPHAWDVLSGEATVLIITVPARFEDFMREWEAAEGDARSEVAQWYGMELLGNASSDETDRS
jgi:hypothetical protein